MPVSKPYLRAAPKHTVVGLGFYLVQKKKMSAGTAGEDDEEYSVVPALPGLRPRQASPFMATSLIRRPYLPIFVGG